MSRRGFAAFDWNSSLQDAEGKSYTQHQLAQNAISTFYDRKYVIVLAHDGAGQKNTAQATEEIIQYAQEQGYTLGTLNSGNSELLHYKKQ